MTQPPQVHTEQRRWLLELLPKSSVGVEIGVHKGDFSQAILDVISPAELHLVDPWRFEQAPEYDRAWYGGQATGGQAEMDERCAGVLARFADEIRAGRVTVHRDDSAAVLSQFPDEYFDWVYIDGNHLHEYVAKDLDLSVRKTKVGGFVTGDDYAEGGWWHSGVKRAVDEFAATAAARLVDIRNGQYVFERLPDT
jgi:hypothetical protein